MLKERPEAHSDILDCAMAMYGKRRHARSIKFNHYIGLAFKNVNFVYKTELKSLNIFHFIELC